jgi:DNA topoisomerase-1
VGLFTDSYQRKLLNLVEKVNPKDLYGTGFWITYKGRPLFIGGAKRADRPKKPAEPVGKKVTVTRKDGTTFTRYVYPKEFVEKQGQHKFAIMASLAANTERLDRVLKLESAGKELSRKKATATVLRVMLLTGARVGGGRAGGPGLSHGEETFGVTTLERRHVKLKGNRVELGFIGKKGVPNKFTVNDKALAGSIRSFMGGKDSDPDSRKRLFTFTEGGAEKVIHRADAVDRLKQFDRDYKPKDLRTLRANEIASEAALDVLDEPPQKPANKKEAAQYIKTVVDKLADTVSSALGNTPAVAKSNYINPALIETVLVTVGLT